MSKPQNKVNNIEKQRIYKALVNKNYNNPWKDSDFRQEKIFNHILRLLEKGYSWRLDTAMLLDNLAKNSIATAEVFSILQPRNEKSGNTDGIKQYVHNFYVLKHRLERIPVMAELESHLYTLAGGKRTAAHVLAIKQGHTSLCDALVLIPPKNLEMHEVLQDLKYISDVSNAETPAATRPMDMASYANSLRAEWDLCCKSPFHWASANMGNLSEEKVRQWARDFLKGVYFYEPPESTFGNIFNQVFSQDRGQVWDYPIGDIRRLWSETFVNQEWVDEPTNGQYCRVVSYSRLQTPFIPVNNEWFKRTEFSVQSDEVGVVLKLDQKTDSISTVLEHKRNALKLLTEYNKNSNFEKSGASVVTRFLFPSHIRHPDDNLTAFEWVRSKLEFCEVKS